MAPETTARLGSLHLALLGTGQLPAVPNRGVVFIVDVRCARPSKGQPMARTLAPGQAQITGEGRLNSSKIKTGFDELLL